MLKEITKEAGIPDWAGRLVNQLNTNVLPQLQTNATFNWAGDASGSTYFNGQGNITANLTLSNTAITPGTYGDATHVAQVTFDSKGRATNASNVPLSGSPGAFNTITKSGNYGLALGDANSLVIYTASGVTLTIPANASVAYPIGTWFEVFNGSGTGSITIAITTDLLVFVPSGATGSRTLADFGHAFIRKATATAWFISPGGGIT